MAKKKGVKKKNSIKKKTTNKKKSPKKRTVSAQTVEIKMQPVLVENFVALQKVMINLSTKFETLNNKLSKLLDLFELSAQNLAKKDFKFGQTEDNQQVVDKLNELTEQNKVIAKGLTMIHEDEQEQKQSIQPPVIPQELAPPKQIPVNPPKVPEKPTPPKFPEKEGEEYKKSTPTFKPLK